MSFHHNLSDNYQNVAWVTCREGDRTGPRFYSRFPCKPRMPGISLTSEPKPCMLAQPAVSIELGLDSRSTKLGPGSRD
jgi:hypothetical protein